MRESNPYHPHCNYSKSSRQIFKTLRYATAIVCTLSAAQLSAQSTEAILIGGGSDVHDSHVRFEDSLIWIRSVLSDQNVSSTAYFNDGDNGYPDVSVASDDSVRQRQALSMVFDDSYKQMLSFRNHRLNNVSGGTGIDVLEPAISAKLTDKSINQLLIVNSGLGAYPGGSEELASIPLWNDSQLNVRQLHQWAHSGNMPVRFVLSQSHSGGFHRLAYKHPSRGLELGSQTHCGFTASSTYGTSETSIKHPSKSEQHDYASYFFSALAGYEYDGEIINRFADQDDDGRTSLREAHMFALLEGKSIDLPLSTSEDYLLRWQPWYLRWQPAQKTLPNNEYTRIFRDVASQMRIALTDNVAKDIRNRQNHLLRELKDQQQLYTKQLGSIAQLQATLQSQAYAQWPQLNAPYTQGYESLVNSGQIPAINRFLENTQPQYTTLLELIDAARQSHLANVLKRREIAQHEKLIQLRHLALLKGQLLENGSAAQIRDYRSLVSCEEAPLHVAQDNI